MMSDSSSRQFALLVFPLLVSSPALIAAGSPPPEVQPAAASPAIVIGFMGGFVGHDNAIHYEVRLATNLRKAFGSGLDVRVFENRRGSQAHREVLRILDVDRNGVLSAVEKSKARIVIYGHSWGASEVVTLARSLARDGIPVALTVQVDSVQKLGENDASIPANVMQAANFYQLDGLLHGRSEIRADDASRTEILGNYQFKYKSRSVNCDGYPWYARVFMKPHIEIESDPVVWGRVETLIRLKLAASP